MTKKELGQYFTTNRLLQDKVLEFIHNNPDCILEPCIGRGDLVSHVKKSLKNVKFDMYEIDKEIQLLPDINYCEVIYKDFLKQHFNKTYKTIIGNPPYVRTPKGNLYIDFTEKCFELLEQDGELIFIVPSDFFKLTCASKLNNKMTQHGTFTHIYHPHDEKLFKDASIDVMVYRYCKNNNESQETKYNDDIMFITNSMGLLTLDKEKSLSNRKFSDVFDIYVGMVSGKESVFKNSLGNITVLTAKEKKEKYICIDKFPCDNKEVNEHLEKNKDCLIKRRIRKFNENNWFQWGALRNIEKIKNNMEKDCIYINTLSRKETVAFQDKVCYFGGSLIVLIPKQNMNLLPVTEYLNSKEFKVKFTSSGRFKIGHRQISNSVFPF